MIRAGVLNLNSDDYRLAASSSRRTHQAAGVLDGETGECPLVDAPYDVFFKVGVLCSRRGYFGEILNATSLPICEA